jgi:NAD(P)-dependent dehydrogenase (short-subunit alcohol dehydrogenase family)
VTTAYGTQKAESSYEPTPVAVVTGGAQGIGRAIVSACLDSGYAVVVLDPDREALDELRLCVDTEALVGVVGDCADEASVGDLIRIASERFGSVSLAVHNAGISVNQPLESLSYEQWRRVIDVNLSGAFLLARAAVGMLRQSRGSIVNIASTRALMSEADTEAYSASKGGIVALTHSLAVSLGPEIRVNCVSPGWIETGPLQKQACRTLPAHSEADRLQHPVGRVGTPGDIARAVLFLSDPANGFITGQNVVVDGGMTRRMIYV